MSFSPKTGGPIVPSAFSICDAFQGLRSRGDIRRHRNVFTAEDITGVVKAPIHVSFVEPEGSLGCFDLLFKEIRIALDEPEVMMATLAHELTHALEFMAYKQWGIEAFRYDAEMPYRYRLAEGRAEVILTAFEEEGKGVCFSFANTATEHGIRVAVLRDGKAYETSTTELRAWNPARGESRLFADRVLRLVRTYDRLKVVSAEALVAYRKRCVAQEMREDEEATAAASAAAEEIRQQAEKEYWEVNYLFL